MSHPAIHFFCRYWISIITAKRITAPWRFWNGWRKKVGDLFFQFFMEEPMRSKSAFTKVLAITGTILVWFPILAMIVFSAVRFFQVKQFLMDYLIPAEIFPVVLVGGLLLLWAAIRAHARLKLVIWGLVAAVVLLVGSQVVAVLTGLASGEAEAGGWQMMLSLAGIVGYDLCGIFLGVAGILLTRDLFRKPVMSVNSAVPTS